jgi:hypothetical protein
MNITIDKMKRDAIDGVVTSVYWSASLEEGGYTGYTNGIKSFARGPSSPTLIPFDKLTEIEVIGWLGINDLITDALNADIAEQKTPKTIFGKPWSR